MRAGILTYHNTRNCGAVLQAYALQRALLKMGIENQIIDYRCKKIDDAYRLRSFHELKNAKIFIKWLLTINSNKKSQEKFDRFRAKNLELSDIYTKENICNANDVFDGFITGSDQVWNFHLNGEDYTYLLDFAENGKKKISYAASMGNISKGERYHQVLKSALSSFDCISVREKQLEEYMARTANLTPALVLDPTLLLKKEDYNFSGNWEKPRYKYIFVYTVAATPNIEKAAREFSKKTGYRIIWGHMSYKKKRGVKNITDLSPEDFVNYIKNAEFVLTSSFHGMAFSIIMEKQFFYDLDTGIQNNNSRLETLADLLDLQSRNLSPDLGMLNDQEPIDYCILSKTLDARRNESISFLKTAFT